MSFRKVSFKLSSKSLENIRSFYRDKGCSIRVGNTKILISKELSILISKEMYKQFSESTSEYQIDLSENLKNSEEIVSKCMKKLVGLAETDGFIDVSEAELPIMMFLSKCLKNDGLNCCINEAASSNGSYRIYWSSKMLSGFNCFRNSDIFHFDVCGEKFECPKVLAQLLSSEVSKRLQTDPTLRELKVSPPEGCDVTDFLRSFSGVFGILSGNSVKVSEENEEITETVCSEIGCDELFEALQKVDMSLRSIDISNIYDRLRHLRIVGQSSENIEAIRFAASNFYALNFEALRSTPIAVIQKVLESPQLRLRDERQLFDFAKSQLSLRGRCAIPLFSDVKFEFLDSSSLDEFFEIVGIESVTDGVWRTLMNRLKCEVNIETPPNSRWIENRKCATEQQIEALQNLNSILQTKMTESELRISELSSLIQAEMKKCADFQKRNEELETKFKLNLSADLAMNSLRQKIPLMEKNSAESNSGNTDIKGSFDEAKAALSIVSEQNSSLQKELSEIEGKFFVPKRMEFPLKSESDGVFAFLYRQRGNKNPHSEGIVQATASSSHNGYPAENIFIWGNGQYWLSNALENEWIQIDFRQNAFILKEFAIFARGAFIPRSFTVLAGDDSSSLSELKEFSFSNENTNSEETFRFSVDSDRRFKVFRIRQKSKSYNGGYYFSVYSIEFFGSLICDPNSTLI